jgi:hypothetical protein
LSRIGAFTVDGKLQGLNMKALVTLGLGKQWETDHGHDPSNKKSGPCPVDQASFCTDTTCANHTVLMNVESLSDIFRRAKEKNASVMRIEIITGERFTQEDLLHAEAKSQLAPQKAADSRDSEDLSAETP